MILSRIRSAIQLLFVLFAVPALAEVAVLVASAYPQPIRLMDLIPIGGMVQTRYLGIGAIVIAGSGVTLLLTFQVAAWICGTNRRLLAAVFGFVVRGVSLVLAGLVALDAAVAIYSLLLIEVTLLDYFNLGIFLAISGGASFAVSEVARGCWKASETAELEVLAIPLDRATEPRLWASVEAVAGMIGARVPDQILIGPQPNFFAAATPLRLFGSGQRIEGETLHLSGPLMRILSVRELTAIIGHELAHFRGEDLAFSARFVPIYQSLSSAIEAMSLDSGWHGLSTRPARAILAFGLARFASAERKIRRERELIADDAGSKAAGPQSMVGALCRVAIGQIVWPGVTKILSAMIQRGQAVGNLSEVFALEIVALRDGSDPGALLAGIGGQSQPHPMDEHPPTLARAQALGVPFELGFLNLDAESPPSIELLDAREPIETGLTEVYNRFLISRGLARPPSNRPTALQRKKETFAKRAAARRRVLERDAEGRSGSNGAQSSPPVT